MRRGTPQLEEGLAHPDEVAAHDPRRGHQTRIRDEQDHGGPEVERAQLVSAGDRAGVAGVSCTAAPPVWVIRLVKERLMRPTFAAPTSTTATRRAPGSR